jgi:hypothetical protein
MSTEGQRLLIVDPTEVLDGCAYINPASCHGWSVLLCSLLYLEAARPLQSWFCPGIGQSCEIIVVHKGIDSVRDRRAL